MIYCELINNCSNTVCNAVKIVVFGLITNTRAYVIRSIFDCSAIVKKLIYISFLNSFSYICAK